MSDAWRTTPTLVGRHVTLRPLVAEDKDALVAVAATDDLWDIFYASVSQLKDADRWFAATFAQVEQGRALVFAVCDPAGAVVGTTRYMRMNEGHRRLEIGGTFYATRVQRTGVNTEAKRLLLTHAFDAMGVTRARFSVVGHGKRDPVATNATAAGMRQNRRVEVTLLGRRATEFARY